MRISSLKKVSDTPASLRFAHPHGLGWIVVVVGGALAGAGLLDAVDDGRWAAVGIGAFFLFMGLATVLHRVELDVDWETRGSRREAEDLARRLDRDGLTAITVR